MARKVGSNGAETASRIRGAALALFAQYGYASVSMRQIAAQIGVQAAALYNHFPTKQDLLLDLMREHMVALIKAWEKANVDRSNPTNALLGFVRFHIHYHIGREDDVFISYMELRNLEGDNYDTIELLRKEYEKHLSSILQSGMDDESFLIEDLHVTTMATIAMLTGLTTWYRSEGRLSIDQIEKIYCNLISRSVGITER